MDFLRDLPSQSIEKAGSVILLICVVLFIILERIFPYTKGVKIFRQGFWMDLVWYTFIQSYFLKILIFDFIIIPLKEVFELSDSGYISQWPVWVLLLFFLITHDFYIYWFHRWQHQNKYLWRTHEAHHSARDVDWLAGSRSHALEILINQTIEFLPIFFLLDTKTAAIIVPLKALLDAIWGMWIHANINVKTGKLQYIINGPEMHQWHHANHKEVFYANYSTKFAFWDWIFGTAFLPGMKPIEWKITKPLSFGLPYNYPLGYFSQTIYALFRFDFKSVNSFSLRNNFIKHIKQFSGHLFKYFGIMNFVKHLLTDAVNKSYEIDKVDYLCTEKGHKMRYYYDENQLKFHCEKCNVDLKNDFNKFGMKQ
ncbi:MAG: sterol desaturase family protein [Saprospiraceae bacterium]|nr:sterol desaturase family protein [Saprospiraceae bacterium]